MNLRLFPLLVMTLLLANSAHAAVELGLAGAPPTVIRDTYQRDDTTFLAVADILPPLGLHGAWDSGRHRYRIYGPAGELFLSPASRYLRFGKKSITLKQKPRFIDGQLRVPEEVLTTHLPRLFALDIVYRSQGATAPPGDSEQPPPPLETPLPPSVLMKLGRVILDPGHGGSDPGSLSAGGDKEKDIVLAVARQLEKLLKMGSPLPVLLTRDGDYQLAAPRRLPSRTESAGGGVFLSLHAGAWHNAEAKGCTLFVAPPPAQADGSRPVDFPALQLATELALALQSEGITTRTLQAPLFPLSGNPLPAVLIELGYLTNPDDLLVLRSADGQQRLARALLTGLRHYAQRTRSLTDDPTAQ